MASITTLYLYALLYFDTLFLSPLLSYLVSRCFALNKTSICLWIQKKQPILKNHPTMPQCPPPAHPTFDISKVIRNALEEDAGGVGDITTLATCGCAHPAPCYNNPYAALSPRLSSASRQTRRRPPPSWQRRAPPRPRRSPPSRAAPAGAGQAAGAAAEPAARG